MRWRADINLTMGGDGWKKENKAAWRAQETAR